MRARTTAHESPGQSRSNRGMSKKFDMPLQIELLFSCPVFVGATPFVHFYHILGHSDVAPFVKDDGQTAYDF
jgi:hypothetical protein